MKYFKMCLEKLKKLVSIKLNFFNYFFNDSFNKNINLNINENKKKLEEGDFVELAFGENNENTKMKIIEINKEKAKVSRQFYTLNGWSDSITEIFLLEDLIKKG